MQSIITEIFHGNRSNAKTFSFIRSAEHTSLINKISNKMKERSDTDFFELHEKFVAVLNESHSDEIDFYFKEGFKLGLRIAVECMEE